MDNNLKFETVMEKLEGEVKKLEAGNMSLDESLASFEAAVGYAKLCNQKLEEAEARVRVLIESADGSVSDCGFIGDGDAT